MQSLIHWLNLKPSAEVTFDVHGLSALRRGGDEISLPGSRRKRDLVYKKMARTGTISSGNPGLRKPSFSKEL